MNWVNSENRKTMYKQIYEIPGILTPRESLGFLSIATTVTAKPNAIYVWAITGNHNSMVDVAWWNAASTRPNCSFIKFRVAGGLSVHYFYNNQPGFLSCVKLIEWIYLPFIHVVSLMVPSISEILYISQLTLYVWVYLTKDLLQCITVILCI